MTSRKETTNLPKKIAQADLHRLRTPITAIIWYTEVLQMKDTGPLTIKQKDYLDEIYQAAQKMIRLLA